MSCRLLLLLPLLVNTAPATYTVHLLYYKHNAQSEAALAELLAQLCSAFTCGEQGGQLDSVTVWGDTLVTVPAALLGSVLPWLLQHRDGRVAGPPDTQVQQALPGCAPLTVCQPWPSLDLALHPDTERGPDWDWEQFTVWAGRHHPLDTNKLYAAPQAGTEGRNFNSNIPKTSGISVYHVNKDCMHFEKLNSYEYYLLLKYA